MFFTLFVLSVEACPVGVVFGGPAVQFVILPLPIANGSIVFVVRSLAVFSALKPVTLVVVSIRVDHPAPAGGLVIGPVSLE